MSSHRFACLPIILLQQFSVDDFESVGSTSWEGVRNYEARNLMKEMVLGDKVSRYSTHSLSCEARIDSILPFQL
jgi:predicted RNA-binding protein with PUA-like domain